MKQYVLVITGPVLSCTQNNYGCLYSIRPATKPVNILLVDLEFEGFHDLPPLTEEL